MSSDMTGSIVITGMGMVSALGVDLATSCAAARAGISRVVELNECNVYEEETGELVPIKGFVVPGAEGFSGLGRLVRLGQMGLKNLMANTDMNCEDLAKAHLFITVSSGYYSTQWLQEQLKDEGGELSFDYEQMIRAEEEERVALFRKNYITRLSELTGISFDKNSSNLYFGEQAGVMQALSDAAECLRTKRAECCVVGGIDSLVDSKLLESLLQLNILKTVSSPTGFVPGEASAFLVLETESRALARKTSVLATIHSISVARDTCHRFAEFLPLGQVLGAVIKQSAHSLPIDLDSVRLVIGNLNGDEWKAMDWGYALLGLPDSWRSVPHWNPVESFGEVGAASAAVACCVGIRAYQREYVGAGTILVWLSGDDGLKGSFFLQLGMSEE